MRRGPGRPPGFKGSSNRKIKYECQNCHAQVPPHEMIAKRVVYLFVNNKSDKRIIRTRTIKWLCRACMEAEPEYNQPAYYGAPGMADVDAGTQTPPSRV